MTTTPEQLTIHGARTALQTTSEPPAGSSLHILEAAIKGGITSENVAVVKEIIAMRREEMAFQNKQTFNRAFFALKKDIAAMDFYADKEAKDRNGKTMYKYCGEQEIAEKLEPVLMKHGFAMMFGQRQESERVVAEITLIHESGHEEKREYAVRSGATNAAKDATQADTGATTSAWRHLVTKLFGLKSRITEGNDVRNEGERISEDKVQWLRERMKELGVQEAPYLRIAGAASIEEICEGSYPIITRMLEEKARAKR